MQPTDEPNRLKSASRADSPLAHEETRSTRRSMCRMRNRISLATCALLLVVAAFQEALAQGGDERSAGLPGGVSQCDTTKSHEVPAGAQRILSPEDVDRIRSLLQDESATSPGRALACYFGSIYTDKLTDLVIYVDTSGVRRQVIIRDGEIQERESLRGARFVYVLLFTEDTLLTDVDNTSRRPALSDTKDTAAQKSNGPVLDSSRAVTVRRTSIDYEADPFLVTLVKGFGSKLFGGAPEPQSHRLADDTLLLILHDLGRGTHDVPLYLAFGRIPIGEDTWDRISVEPLEGRRFLKDRTIVTNFENAARSPFGVGLGAGFTFNARTRSLSSDTLKPAGQQTRVTMYLLGHWDIVRSRLPLHRMSFGLTVGTNLLQGDLLNDLVIGASLDRIVGDLGLTGGVNLLSSKRDASGRDTRLLRGFVGVDFRL